MREVVIASKNAGKVAEFAKALSGLGVTVKALTDFGDIPDAVEDGDTFADNAIKKAKHYVQYTGKPCLADDSGLEVDALDGAPGVYSARYAGENAGDAANNQKLLAKMADVEPDKRTARFRCVLAFFTPGTELLTADGCCEGTILSKPRGTGGFGYDPLFYIAERNKTMAELTINEKNAISHRGKAIQLMAEKLAGTINADRHFK